ncbi:MAG: HEAT repeat domain-containing protein [Chlamydiia bacterium]
MQKDHPFTEAIDLEIIMLAYAHFGGDLALMIETLQNNPLHPLKNYPIERIETILNWQEHQTEDLESFLPAGAKKAVQNAKDMTNEMQAAMHEDPDSLHSKIYALLFYEGEEPYSLVDEVVLEQEAAIKPLIKLLKNTHLFDPLYPGFGRSLARIADALKGIGDDQAIAPLFNALLEQNPSIEDALLDALISFQGAPHFLLKILEERPFSIRSTYAAKALFFLKTADVSLAAIDALCDPTIQKHPGLINYLIALLDALDPEDKNSVLQQLLDEVPFSSEHKAEIEIFLK